MAAEKKGGIGRYERSEKKIKFASMTVENGRNQEKGYRSVIENDNPYMT